MSMRPIAWRIRKGDTVRVLRGKDRGKKGKILRMIPTEGRVVVEGLNLVTKHVRARRQGEKNQQVTLAAPVPIANVQLVCPQCAKGTRVGIERDQGERVRVCKQCRAFIR